MLESLVITSYKVVASVAVGGALSLDVAEFKIAFASSVHNDPNYGGYYWPSKANDNIERTNALLPDNSCFMSEAEYNPWWAVDLTIPLSVAGVRFTNRGDSGKCSYTLH